MKKVIKSLFISAALAAAAIAGESENFGGLGISVWPSKGGVKIAGVMPNSPAESIGLQSGDLIISANGTELSAVEPERQVSLIRGEVGSSINLVINRNGNVFSISAKRMGISVQNLDAKDISDWYGKTQGLTGEEVSHLASQKVTEGYQLLGVMQYGMPVSSSAENLNANAIQQISIKKVEEVKLPEQKPIQNSVLDMSLSSKVENSALVNAKGARVAKKQGNVPLYRVLK
ncbi:MAG: PDZ domain-containing protein [Candidatus Fibromonas sp.]|jgi:membrane-associated protease RseP (regulator of RpoE activity)|nr:PDZ domain-containing protein [Candidatus Fibromonas sp.]